MAVLSLRKFPDELMAQLKSEAALAGVPLREYCEAVFRARGKVVAPLYSVNRRTGEIARVAEGMVNERDGGNGSKSSKGERGVRGGGKRLGSGKSAGMDSTAGGKSGGGLISGASEITEAVKLWFPTSKCPHGYMNSFMCEKDNGGCVR